MPQPAAKPATELNDDALANEVNALGAELAAGTARLLELIAAAQERDLWGTWDARSPAEWVSWLTGYSPRVAREHTYVAERLDQLPTTHAALGRGEISFCQARAIARTERPEHEADLVHLATQATTGQLERVVNAYRRASVLNETQAANTAHERRYLNYFFDGADAFVIKGRLGRDDGAIVAQALDSATEELRTCVKKEDDGVEIVEEADPQRQGYERLRADALVAVAEAALDAGASSGRCLPEVVVHVDAEALAFDGADVRCEIEGAGAIATETARRLACDAGVVTLLEKNGEPLAIGRKSRRVPHGLRRALQARDRACRWPGCSYVRRNDAHHIQHWTRDGGETKLENLILLCRFHHRLVHERGYKIERDDSGDPMFVRPDGRAIDAGVRRPPAGPGDLATRRRKAGVTLRREPYAPIGAGEKLNLEYVTWAYFFQHERDDRVPPDPA